MQAEDNKVEPSFQSQAEDAEKSEAEIVVKIPDEIPLEELNVSSLCCVVNLSQTLVMQVEDNKVEHGGVLGQSTQPSFQSQAEDAEKSEPEIVVEIPEQIPLEEVNVSSLCCVVNYLRLWIRRPRIRGVKLRMES
jgi:hypothetical protein